MVFRGAALNAEGMISIGVLYAFVDYLNRLFQPITGIVNQFAKLELARVSSERVFRLLDEPGVDVKEPSKPKERGGESCLRMYHFAIMTVKMC